VQHYEKPSNVGSFDKSDPNVGTGLVGAPACGDVMKLQIRVDDEGNIVDSCFKTFGCGSAIASSSVATEWVKGKSIEKAVAINNSDIAKHLSLPPVKLHCSMLAEDAIKVLCSCVPRNISLLLLYKQHRGAKVNIHRLPFTCSCSAEIILALRALNLHDMHSVKVWRRRDGGIIEPKLRDLLLSSTSCTVFGFV